MPPSGIIHFKRVVFLCVDNRTSLRDTAVKILIYLHFQNPDSYGFMREISFGGLAKLLNVNRRTVMNNISTLVDYMYISRGTIYTRGVYNFVIEGYKEQVEKGGPGYIVVNKQWLGGVFI